MSANQEAHSAPETTDRNLHDLRVHEEYEVLSPIGQGGFGGTFLVRDKDTNEQLVIKVVPDAKAAHAEAESSGAELAKQLPPHPHIVRIRRPLRSIAGGFYYAMEPADNCHPNADATSNLPYEPHTLRHELHRYEGVLPVEQAVAHALAILDALSHLRKSFLIHQDLKPSNIIFVDGVLKICDFSLVTGRPDPDAEPSLTGGTPPYGGDMHATAMMFYEMLGGKAQDPMTPTKAIPREIWSVICRGAAGKYSGPQEMREALERACAPASAAPRHTAWIIGVASAVVLAAVFWVATRATRDAHETAVAPEAAPPAVTKPAAADAEGPDQPFHRTAPKFREPALAPALVSATEEGEARVAANRYWSDTGLDLNRGQTITISASGQITGCRAPRTDWAFGPWGPEGFMHEGKRICCLIAKVESPEQKKELYIGKGLTFQTPFAGRLYLGVADLCNRDNTGAFIAAVKIDGQAVDFRTLQKSRPVPAPAVPAPTPSAVRAPSPRLPERTYAVSHNGRTIDVPEGMIYVPAGEFTMGDDDTRDAAPKHTVYLDAYLIDKFEVTNAEYKQFVDATGHKPPLHWPNGKIPEGRENCPVVNVHWPDAAAYAQWAGKRLPTEAEWERAARGTDGRTFPWGNEPAAASRCNYRDRAVGQLSKKPAEGVDWTIGWDRSAEGRRVAALGGYTQPVGSYENGKSPVGCYDMAGNACEWCADHYLIDYYTYAPPRNPKGPADAWSRAMRGGGWLSPVERCRCFDRFNGTERFRSDRVGFRCAMDAPQAK